MKKLLPLAVACCLAVTCLTETPPPAPANRLIGLWKLVRIEATRANGSITTDPDFGPDAIGYISYDQTGHMSVQIIIPDLPNWKDEDHPSAAEALSTIERGYSAYAGTYEVPPNEGYVVHHLERALGGNSVGQRWKRKFTLDGRLLRLTPPPFNSVSGERLDETLIWERVQ